MPFCPTMCAYLAVEKHVISDVWRLSVGALSFPAPWAVSASPPHSGWHVRKWQAVSLHPCQGPWHCAQVAYFEFSNETFNNAYNGLATAKQYAAALADWAPKLKSILPGMKLGANGQPGVTSMGNADKSQNTGVQWWPTARLRPTRQQSCKPKA